MQANPSEIAWTRQPIPAPKHAFLHAFQTAQDESPRAPIRVHLFPGPEVGGSLNKAQDIYHMVFWLGLEGIVF